ncbi:peptidoglycan-associated lipoprotein Pal [Chlorobium limicola]
MNKPTLFLLFCAIGLGGCSSKSSSKADEYEKSAQGSGYGTGEYGPGSYGSGSQYQNVLGDVFFEFDSSLLSADAQETLSKNAAWLKQNPRTKVTIEGHCDAVGTSEYNMALGERRADAAGEYLKRLGVEASRMNTVSYGEERPFSTGTSEEDYAQNRRAHFVVK